MNGEAYKGRRSRSPSLKRLMLCQLKAQALPAYGSQQRDLHYAVFWDVICVSETSDFAIQELQQ